MKKLFYPLGKCEEQVIATEKECQIFILLILKNIQNLLKNHSELMTIKHKMLSASNHYVEGIYHYVETFHDDPFIMKKVGYYFKSKTNEQQIDICEYRLKNGQVISKLLGRINYNMKTGEITISSIRHYFVVTRGVFIARYIHAKHYNQKKFYLSPRK